MKKILASFASAFVGWLCGFGYIAVYQKLFSRFGHMTDVAFWFFLPGFWVLLCWMFVVLPFIFYADAQGLRFKGFRGVLLGAFCGISILFLITLLLGMMDMWRDKETLAMFGGYSIIVGAVTVFLYDLLMRRQKQE